MTQNIQQQPNNPGHAGVPAAHETTNEDYDPDNFDWGDESDLNIDLGNDGDAVVSAMVSAAMKASEDAFGWSWIARGDITESRKKMFKVKVVVKEEDRAWIEQEWPAYAFVWDTAHKHHDHPVSHLATELNEIEMVDDLVASGTEYIDLFGNGNRDGKYRRRCRNLYTLATPKDYIRAQKPNVRDQKYNLDELCDPESDLGKIDDVTCTHALYYLTMDDIGRIVNTSGKRRLRALIHRHPESAGTLNRGELRYKVSFEGDVEQVNVLTGEKYTHPSMEALFHQSSARTAHGGVAWTSRKAGGDSFFVDFVGCPSEMCDEYVPLVDISPETRTIVELDGVRVKTFLHFTWIVHDTANGQVVLDDVDLFTKLRRFASCKKRDARLMNDLAHHARRLTNKADIIAIHGGGAHEISSALLSDYVNAAFYVDVRHELETALAFQKANERMVAALNAYYENGVVPADFTLPSKVINVISGAGKKSVQMSARVVADHIAPVVVPAVKAAVKDAAHGTIFDTRPRAPRTRDVSPGGTPRLRRVRDNPAAIALFRW
jgi:hypothetical protein